jgi:hypothetical protein
MFGMIIILSVNRLNFLPNLLKLDITTYYVFKTQQRAKKIKIKLSSSSIALCCLLFASWSLLKEKP